MNAIIKKGRAAGTVKAPPSKSMAHRLLICAALAGRGKIEGLEYSRDIEATVDCLRALGANIVTDGDTAYVGGSITGGGECELFCAESGSTLRFMIPLCLLSGGRKTLFGSDRLMSRPLGVYEDIFSAQGIDFRRGDGSISVCGRLCGGTFEIPGDVSSQFVSGLMFALPMLPSGEDSTIRLLPPLQSLSYIDLTIRALEIFGVRIDKVSDSEFRIYGGGKYSGTDAIVEGDFSNAAFFEAMNLFGGDVRVTGLDPESLQGDKVYAELFRELSTGTPTISLRDCPDLGPILMTVAAAKNGARFTDTRRLKIKESDRGTAMAAELAKFGAKIEVFDDEIIVRKTELHAPREVLLSHNDHRIVMSLAVLCLIYGGEIAGAEAVNKSMPNFFPMLESLGTEVTLIEA